VAHVAYSELDEVARAQLAVDTQIKKGKLPQPALHLQANAECPDLLQLERGFLTDQLALVPCLAMGLSTGFVHDHLLSVEGDSTLRRAATYFILPRENPDAESSGRRSTMFDPKRTCRSVWHAPTTTIPFAPGDEVVVRPRCSTVLASSAEWLR
jgi:hypothetical protein